jgi:hypothetical protein
MQMTVEGARLNRRGVEREAFTAAIRESVVYFLIRENLIKIGTTVDLARRTRQIASGESMPPGMTVGPVEVLATMPGGVRQEAELHARFAAHRVSGTEWFALNGPLLEFIHSLRRSVA